MRKRLLVVAGLATALTGTIAGAAGAGQSPAGSYFGSSPLVCFDGTHDGGYYGLCSMKSGVATLDNRTNDATGTANSYDQYSGIYPKKSNLVGKAIADVKELGFTYGGDAATAGSPRISLGIDTNADGNRDDYAFISAYYCNDGAGKVDAVNDATCTIYTGSGVYANWADMVAKHPGYRVAGTPFVIADDPGVWTVSNVQLGQVPALRLVPPPGVRG